MSIFGVLSERGRGHVVTAILIAMVAMLFTAISYGRMARVYPSAGSAFTYVGQEIIRARLRHRLEHGDGLHAESDYLYDLVQPAGECVCAGVPYAFWAVFFAGLFTWLNILGIKASARINAAMATGMGVVIAIFFVVAARYIFGHPHADPGFFSRPFYDPQTFHWNGLFGCTSIAVLTISGLTGFPRFRKKRRIRARIFFWRRCLRVWRLAFCRLLRCMQRNCCGRHRSRFRKWKLRWSAAGRAWLPLFGIVGGTLLVANFGSGLAR